jgi:hypothetical protein
MSTKIEKERLHFGSVYGKKQALRIVLRAFMEDASPSLYNRGLQIHTDKPSYSNKSRA